MVALSSGMYGSLQSLITIKSKSLPRVPTSFVRDL